MHPNKSGKRTLPKARVFVGCSDALVKFHHVIVTTIIVHCKQP